MLNYLKLIENLGVDIDLVILQKWRLPRLRGEYLTWILLGVWGSTRSWKNHVSRIDDVLQKPGLFCYYIGFLEPLIIEFLNQLHFERFFQFAYDSFLLVIILLRFIILHTFLLFWNISTASLLVTDADSLDRWFHSTFLFIDLILPF